MTIPHLLLKIKRLLPPVAFALSIQDAVGIGYFAPNGLENRVGGIVLRGMRPSSRNRLSLLFLTLAVAVVWDYFASYLEHTTRNRGFRSPYARRTAIHCEMV